MITGMKIKLFATVVGIALVAAVSGCISTVTDTHVAGMPFEQDHFSARYQRPLDDVYDAAKNVIRTDGVLVTEYIPHDTTNTVRALFGKVNQCDVWVRVSAVNPQITQIEVQVRNKWGNHNLDLAHELDKEIALQLTTH
jgi:Protein of unknown function (DUF3568)